MSHTFEFDDDETPWSDTIKEKQKTKRVKQRRRDNKRRFVDDNAIMDFTPAKWK
ncbi:small highly charged protein [Shewanella sp. SR44-3]|uniref:small highly charged protein n=1 Tax=unclassified Shewanella TaxID=196818 RepID=UPI0015F97444|nr:small highly charged protein [Shewanella sp. SR44-3]MBB1269876.1 small highly charged protein [Shewanella sp. SR44-3]